MGEKKGAWGERTLRPFPGEAWKARLHGMAQNSAHNIPGKKNKGDLEEKETPKCMGDGGLQCIAFEWAREKGTL